MECLICTETQNKEDFLKMKCGHNNFCKNCYFNYIVSNINDINLLEIKCIDTNCKQIIDNKIILQLVTEYSDENILKKFNQA